MTKAQWKRYRWLAEHQVNRQDASVIEESESGVTIHIVFPGLYLTYNPQGELLGQETEAQRREAGGLLAGHGTLLGEMG